MNADADLHLVICDVEGRLAGRRHRATRQRDPDRARGGIDAVTQHLQGGEVAALFGGRPDDLLHDQRAGDAAPSRRKSRFLHRDIVISNHDCDRAFRHFARHVEIHDVAFVVLDDEQDTAAIVGRLGSGKNEIRRRRSKNLAGTCGVEHAVANKAGMKRLVSGTAAR